MFLLVRLLFAEIIILILYQAPLEGLSIKEKLGAVVFNLAPTIPITMPFGFL